MLLSHSYHCYQISIIITSLLTWVSSNIINSKVWQAQYIIIIKIKFSPHREWSLCVLIVKLQWVLYMYVVIFEGLVLWGWQLRKGFHHFIFQIHLYPSYECILIKEWFEDDNFTSSKVTKTFAKFYPSIFTVYLL